MSEIVAYEDGPRGSVALRRWPGADGDVYDLIVDGTFVMDTLVTSTEELLAEAALERLDTPATVVVGGLGLGFTVRALLADHRVGRIDVVELEQSIVDWVRQGLVPPTAGVLADPRVHAHVADILDFLPSRPDSSADAVLLDVDNGPDFLVHLANSTVYEQPFVTECGRLLRPGGVLMIWSASPSAALHQVLTTTFGDCEQVHRRLRRDDRVLDYYLYVATRQS